MMLLFWIFFVIFCLSMLKCTYDSNYTQFHSLVGQTYKISKGSNNYCSHCIRHPEKIIRIKIGMIYFTISQVPVCHTLHTPPDIVTGWHILCLIYFFMYNTSLNQTRTEISTFMMSLHQLLEGCSSTFFTPRSMTIRLYHWPDGQGPFPPSSGSSTPSGLITSSTPDSIPSPHGTPVVCTHPESWTLLTGTLYYFIF